MAANGQSGMPRLHWHRAYTARLLVEFKLRYGVFRRRQDAITIPMTPSSSSASASSSVLEAGAESHGWTIRPVGLWGAIIRHPRSQQFALIRHINGAPVSSGAHVPPPPPPSMHATLLSWRGLDPTRAWCKVTESYLLAAESFTARQLQVWLLRSPHSTNPAAAAMARTPSRPFLVDVPGRAGDRFGISVHDQWCLIYTRPCPIPTSAHGVADDESALILTTMTQQRSIYAYHIPTRRWSAGSCIGREGQAHWQLLTEHCVYVYVCHTDGPVSTSDVEQGNHSASVHNGDDDDDDDTTAEPAPAWTHQQQVIRWRVWELGLHTVAPRCVAYGRILQAGRPSRWIHACRVDDLRVVLYTSRDMGAKDMLLMHSIGGFDKQCRDGALVSSAGRSSDAADIVWQARIKGILTVTPMLSIGYLCVHDRLNRIQLFNLDDGTLLRSLLFDGHRPAGQLLGHTYLMNISTSVPEQPSAGRRRTRSRRRQPTSDGGKRPPFERGVSQVLDLQRGTPAQSITTMIAPLADEASAHQRHNWEVCCSYALRIKDVRMAIERGAAASADIDVEWIAFTGH
ncbi:hypothetical protein SYNPS1DRAFT_29881 [Syncephalis pseudoplumigaleata]|uniref:Uncharacterized protein n=1 Tax=Syncephalis pseudoplumigaleata TaxID=1712513 RepID=A0A4P9YZ91_9FUNG|nr:hypothetical protein SYNPS1DRAFT_29881 [Syncephalis pseudoplumigaleata]|eukprot:RKP24350.1 hypothetical protein SYNPS1DRAFT_29881 [Syncephalis pseudoplumigaleata]